VENSDYAPVNPLLMDGKTVLVTGASSGIGRETAILLSQLKARVVLVGRDLKKLEETRTNMSGSDHLVQAIDLTGGDLIPGWLRQITVETGPMAGLVHCAGIHQAIPLRVLTAEKVDEVMRTNVTGAIMLVKAFRQKGCCAKPASIVLMSSVAGIVGQSAVSAYSASKAAICGFTRSAAMELAPEGIRVNCIAPGSVPTRMTDTLRDKLTPEQFIAIESSHPLGLGMPRDIAYASAFLLAETGRWITGTTLVVDGGFSAH
jgi:NAD(P)-dependent dehydrogenase (short-subunit alcohol dehydrogenase family)